MALCQTGRVRPSFQRSVRSRAVVRPMRRIGSGLIVALCLLLGCPARHGPANIILVTLDTLRADHLGCYGYERPTSPNIDRLAAAATLYTRSYASSPWTVPSHASLFTGLYPFEHGAHSFPVEGVVTNVNPLSQDQMTLTEALSGQGWRTGAFVANSAFLGPRWGFSQGFDEYSVDNRHGKELNQAVFSWLEQQTQDPASEQPFFLFLNYMDTHWPYNTAALPGFAPQAVAKEERQQLKDSLERRIMPGDGALPLDLLRILEGQYDASIANVDEAIGDLVAKLKELGVYERTMLVITSDHGEYLGEHHLLGHSKDVYEGAVRVPLLIKYPGQRRGRVVDTLISSPDVPRLVVDALPGDVGRRLAQYFPYELGSHPVMAENYYARLRDLSNSSYGHRFQRVRTAIYDFPWKYIRSSDGAHELYRLDDDSAEAANQIGDRAELAHRLDAELRRFQAERQSWQGTFVPATPSEDELRRLRALGYADN